MNLKAALSVNSLDKEVGVLPPEWCALDKESGEIIQSTSPQPSSSEYSYNAFRIPWRVALDIYSDKILNKLYEDGEQSYWEDPKSYYTQNWAWFATALHSDNLPNLWRTD